MPESTLEGREVVEWRGFSSPGGRAGGGRIAGIAVVCALRSRRPWLWDEGHVGTEAARGDWKGAEEMEDVGQRKGDLAPDRCRTLHRLACPIYVEMWRSPGSPNYVRTITKNYFQKLIDTAELKKARPARGIGSSAVSPRSSHGCSSSHGLPNLRTVSTACSPQQPTFLVPL